MRQFGVVSRDGSDTGAGPPAQVHTQPPHSQYRASANPISAGDLPRSHRGSLKHLLVRVYRKARQGPRAFSLACGSFVIRRVPLSLRREARRLVTRAVKRRRRFHGLTESWCPCVPGLVSVVLPVYNQAEFLAGSIESVLAQTYRDFELIIVNDGSRDGVEPVLARYSDHPRIRILTQDNQKLPKALSNGFTFAQGEFWTWTSADNLMHPQQLERQVAFLRGHPEAAMVYADYLAIDDRGEPLNDPTFRPQDRVPPTSPEIHLPRSVDDLNIVPDNFIGACFLYRGWVGRVIGDYDNCLGVEDYDYWMRINELFEIKHLGTSELLYSYRVHDNTLSARANQLKIFDGGRELMRYQRDRAAYFNIPWTIRVGPDLHARLGKASAGPHRLDAWAFGDEAQAGDRDGPAPGSGRPDKQAKILTLAGIKELRELVARGVNPRGVIAVWVDSADQVYEYRIELDRHAKVAFTDLPEAAERLELIGTPGFVVRDRQAMIGLAIKYADNQSFVAMTRPRPTRERTLPTVFPSCKKRTILIQVDHFDQGGLENAALSLVRGLANRGYETALLVLGRCGPAATSARRAGLSVITLPEQNRERHYRQLLTDLRVGLISAHYSVFGAAIAAELGIALVQVVQNTYVWLGPERIEEFRRADPFTSAYACVSTEVARYCDLSLGLAVEKMVVIPNGIDISALDASRSISRELLRREIGIDDADFVFLNVASIHGTKAQVPLVQAMARLVGSHPRARLVLVGPVLDDEYLKRVKEQIARLGLEQSVILTGARDDVAGFYRMADAFVLPSYWEGWSLALSEALYMGLPVVASDVGGARELLAQGAGRLVRPPFGAITDLDFGEIGRLVNGEDPRFVSELAEAMEHVCESSCPAPLSDQIRISLDQEHFIAAHDRLYRWLIQGGTASAARAWFRARTRDSSVVNSES